MNVIILYGVKDFVLLSNVVMYQSVWKKKDCLWKIFTKGFVHRDKITLKNYLFWSRKFLWLGNLLCFDKVGFTRYFDFLAAITNGSFFVWWMKYFNQYTFQKINFIIIDRINLSEKVKSVYIKNNKYCLRYFYYSSILLTTLFVKVVENFKHLWKSHFDKIKAYKVRTDR